MAGIRIFQILCLNLSKHRPYRSRTQITNPCAKRENSGFNADLSPIEFYSINSTGGREVWAMIFLAGASSSTSESSSVSSMTAGSAGLSP